jgi:hypothetical protein
MEVSSCHDCPFRNYSYDDFALGDAESHSCILLQREWMYNAVEGNLTHANYFINFFKNGNVKSKNKRTLNNCPLLETDFSVTLK